MVTPGIAGAGELFGILGGIGVPGIELLLLLLLPYLDRSKAGVDAGSPTSGCSLIRSFCCLLWSM